MSQAEYARHRHVSREAVRKAIDQGRLPRLADRRIDWRAADVAWEESTLPHLGGDHPRPRGQRGANQTLLQHRARRESVLADREEFRFLADRKLLVPADEILTAATEASRTALDLLFAALDRLAAPLAATSEPAECRRLMRGEIEHVREILARPLNSLPAEIRRLQSAALSRRAPGRFGR
jgi:hypothetical protein